MSRRQQVILMMVILALVAAWDFFGRVYVGRDDSLRSFQPPQIEPLPARPDANAVRSELVSWMPSLAGTAGVAAAPADPSGWELSLVGVFSKDAGRFALVHARPRSGRGGAELLSVQEGDELHGATVREIGPKRVRLAQGGESRDLLLFERGKTPPAAPAASAAGPAPVARSGKATTYTRGSGKIEEARARLRANQASAAAANMAPVARKPPVAATAPGPESSLKPSTGSPGGRPAAAPQELEPGEEVKLPWDLPVVEDGGSTPQKKP